MTNKIFFLVILLGIINLQNAFSEGYAVTGLITDRETGKPVPGATIRIMNSTKGTYSSSKGKFRLPFIEGSQTLKISSLGYESVSMDISNKTTDTLFIKLKQIPVSIKGTEKVAAITSEELVRRAIEKKDSNVHRLKTFMGLLYTKMVVELGGALFDKDSAGGKSDLVVGMTVNEDEQQQMQREKFRIMENFSNVFIDFEKEINHREVVQRRQTANVPSEQNLLAIMDFKSFYREYFQIMDARLVTPLSKDALSYYKFSIIEKSVLDDRYIYIIDVQPATDIYPLFSGTMKIVEGTYNLAEIDVKPSKPDAITLFKDLHISQKFSEYEKDLWYPAFLEITGKVSAEVIKGVFTVDLEFLGTSIFSDVRINEPLPDSIYAREEKRRVTVGKNADSAKTEFWEKNSMRDLSEHEKEIYQKVDSIVVVTDSLKKEKSNFDFNYLWPVIDFNRVNSVMLGWVPSLTFKSIKLSIEGEYSFGLRKPFGEASLFIPLIDTFYTNLRVSASIFTKVSTASFDNSYPRFINTVASALFHTDYYDYFRKDGWSAGFSLYYRYFTVWGSAEFSRNFSLPKTTDITVFRDDKFRDNPSIPDGNYRVGYLGLRFSTSSLRLPPMGGLQAEFTFTGLYGDNLTKGIPFKRGEGHVVLSAPTFTTGYSPMELTLILKSGIGSNNLPFHYQFRQPSGLVMIGTQESFYSAPVAYYGGNEYYAGHLRYSLSDLWWRAVGLPLYAGRGIDLILTGSAGKYFNSLPLGYWSTDKEFYYEAGFSLARIPTFVSNVIYLSFDARWGIGFLGSGRFGWGINITTPFNIN